jgi:hypothetical protein
MCYVYSLMPRPRRPRRPILVQINFRGPLEMRESLNALAARQRRTMSDFLRLQMEDLIKRSKRANVA